VIPGFDSLAKAVRATFPPEFCRVLAIRERGDAAVALFDTRPSAQPYLYEVHYQREGGQWSEGGSGNGSGWHRFTLESDLGVVTAWGEPPPDADMVRGDLEGSVVEEAVANGVYFMVWWDVPCSTPRVTAFRVKGEWTRAPTMWEQYQAERMEWLRTRGS
jgi:hypothetical protein